MVTFENFYLIFDDFDKDDTAQRQQNALLIDYSYLKVKILISYILN